MIKVFEATREFYSGTEKPGTVIDDQLTVVCGNLTALRLTLLQRPGKKRMQADELLRGFAITPGMVLE